MKRFLPALLLVFLSAPLRIFAMHYDMILVGDPVLEDIRFLSLEAGRPLLSFTLPLSPHEVRTFLDSINESSLSAPALEAFSRIERRLSLQPPLLNFSSDNFSVFADINATIEARARTNLDISWYPHYPEVPPVASLPIRFFIGNFLQLYIEPTWRMLSHHYQHVGYFGVNAPLNYRQYDHLMPNRAFLAAGGRLWNFQIGRDRLSWGTGHMGNLSISDNPDFYDFMRFSFFTRFFRYTSLVVQMPLDIRHVLCDSVFNDSAEPPNHIPPGSSVPPNHLSRTMNRYFYLHRLDIMLFNSLTIGISEGLLVGDSPLELRFLNPMAVFHQMRPWVQYNRWGNRDRYNRGKDGDMLGPFFSVEANWNIINSLSVYGQFTMTQYETSGEVEHLYPYPSPDGMGFLFGVQYSHSFANWASMFFFEFIHTSPFLYMHPSPFASFIHMRIALHGPTEFASVAFPRDIMMFTLGARFFRNNILSVSGIFSLLFNGERGIRYDWQPGWPARDERTPSGIAERQVIGTVSARWRALPFLTLGGSLTGIHSHNNGHDLGAREMGLQASFSASVSF